MQHRQLTKADFHGSLAGRRRFRPADSPSHEPTLDLAVVYRGHGVAHFRAVSASGSQFLAPFCGKREFSHAAAHLLAIQAEHRGLRLIRIGEPALASVAKAASIMRTEVAA